MNGIRTCARRSGELDIGGNDPVESSGAVAVGWGGVA